MDRRSIAMFLPRRMRNWVNSETRQPELPSVDMLLQLTRVSLMHGGPCSCCRCLHPASCTATALHRGCTPATPAVITNITQQKSATKF